MAGSPFPLCVCAALGFDQDTVEQLAPFALLGSLQDKIKQDHRELLRMASHLQPPMRVMSYIKVCPLAVTEALVQLSPQYFPPFNA